MRIWKQSLRHQQGGLAATSLAAPVLVALTLVVAGSAAWGAGVNAHQAHSYQFAAPDAAAVWGADLFVTNGGKSSVTEVNASSGAYVGTISGKGTGLDAPTAIVATGGDLFVANRSNNSVSEFKASGRQHIRTIGGSKYQFSTPIGLALDGPDLFVLNAVGSITEVSVRSGALMGTASGSAFKFKSPTAIAVADGRVFVVNSGGNTVTVLNAGTRTFRASLAGSPFDFSSPKGIAYDGTNLWVTDSDSSSVTEFSPSTLQEVNVIENGNLPWVAPITYGDGYVFTASPPGSSPMVSQIVPSNATVPWMMCNGSPGNGTNFYDFNNPQALAVAGTNLWVVNEGGTSGIPGSNSLTEMNTDTGALIRTIDNP